MFSSVHLAYCFQCGPTVPQGNVERDGLFWTKCKIPKIGSEWGRKAKTSWIQQPISCLFLPSCSYHASMVSASFLPLLLCCTSIVEWRDAVRETAEEKYLREEKPSPWTACWNHTLLSAIPLDSAWILVTFQKKEGPFQALAMFLAAKKNWELKISKLKD